MATESLVVAGDLAQFEELAARWLIDAIAGAVAERGSCSLGLAGGSTPRRIYERLTSAEFIARVPWSRISFFFGDERCVPPDHPDSNFHMAHESLLVKAPVAMHQVHRISGEDHDPDRAARSYERLLPAQLDVLMLGMGADGHTASLFPDSDAVRERSRLVVHAEAPIGVKDRVTITAPVIRAARRKVVLIAGQDKQRSVARALRGPIEPSKVPVQLALAGMWIMDAQAAQLLGAVG